LGSATGNSGETIRFRASLVDDHGGLWTPTYKAKRYILEIEIHGDRSGASFVIRDPAGIITSRIEAGRDDFGSDYAAWHHERRHLRNIDALKGSAAQLQYVSGAKS